MKQGNLCIKKKIEEIISFVNLLVFFSWGLISINIKFNDYSVCFEVFWFDFPGSSQIRHCDTFLSKKSEKISALFLKAIFLLFFKSKMISYSKDLIQSCLLQSRFCWI